MSVQFGALVRGLGSLDSSFSRQGLQHSFSPLPKLVRKADSWAVSLTLSQQLGEGREPVQQVCKGLRSIDLQGLCEVP